MHKKRVKRKTRRESPRHPIPSSLAEHDWNEMRPMCTGGTDVLVGKNYNYKKIKITTASPIPLSGVINNCNRSKNILNQKMSITE